MCPYILLGEQYNYSAFLSTTINGIIDNTKLNNPQKIVFLKTANEKDYLGVNAFFIFIKKASSIGYPIIVTQNIPFDLANTDVDRIIVGNILKEYPDIFLKRFTPLFFGSKVWYFELNEYTYAKTKKVKNGSEYTAVKNALEGVN